MSTFEFVSHLEIVDACRICGSLMFELMHDEQLSLDKERTLVWARYAACEGCGVVQKLPLPSSATLKKYYAESWQDRLARPRQFFDETADWIASHVERREFNLNAIDIGSKGRHMADALARVGWELNWKLVDQNPNGSSVEKVWVGDGLEPSHEFGFICASHVLEHTHDPVTFIKDVLGMLAHRGVAYIEVPSIEAHAEDSATCDDVNQNHLWHFNIDSLCRLVHEAGGSILATAICRTRRNPANRLLIAQRDAADIRAARQMHGLTECITMEYAEAAHVLSKMDPATTCLYAASNSYLRLLSLHPEVTQKFQIFDLYFRGQIKGIQVHDPSEMAQRGFKTALISTRVWAPAQEIKAWIRANIPGVEPVALFPMVEEFQP